MQVQEWMQRKVLIIGPDDSLSDAERMMVYHQIRHLPVVQHGKLVGFITDWDLEAARPSLAISSNVDELSSKWARMQVTEVMRQEMITVAPQTAVAEAARLMRDRQVTALPVLDDCRLVGLLTITDLIRALEDTLEKDQMARGAFVA